MLRQRYDDGIQLRPRSFAAAAAFMYTLLSHLYVVNYMHTEIMNKEISPLCRCNRNSKKKERPKGRSFLE